VADSNGLDVEPEKLDIQLILSISPFLSCITSNPIRPNVMWKHRPLAKLAKHKTNDVAADGDGALGRELWSLSVSEIYVVVFERAYSPVTFNPV